ncbi:MAG: protein translocase subunit SecF [bacterium]
MKIFKKEIDFMGNFKFFGTVSAIAVAVSVILFLIMGLNYGVDFAGGTEIQVKVDGVDTQEMRTIAGEFGSVDIQKFEGRENEFLLRFLSVSMVDDDVINSFLRDVEKEFSEAKMTKTHFDSQVGDRIEIWFENEIEMEKLSTMSKGFNIPTTGKVEYKKVGDRHIYKIMLEGLTTKIVTSIKEKTNQEPELMRVELVGPKVGEKLRTSAFLAVLYSLIAILIYIAIRFNFQFAPGAVLALSHDVLITLGVWALFKIPFDLTIVAAFLTIVGYSLNDTIVMYDRIRENWNNPKKGATTIEKINTSINETLSRTLLTSLTTLLVLIVLLIFGGGVISGFAFAMTLGVVVGTYSSIFIASPITVLIERYMGKGKTI